MPSRKSSAGDGGGKRKPGSYDAADITVLEGLEATVTGR